MKRYEGKNKILKNLNIAPAIYWSDVCIISFLQRVVIIHSVIYYEMSENILRDSEYDEISYFLVDMQSKVTKSDLKKTEYYEAFKDFDGTTGFDIFERLNKKDKSKIKRIVYNILKMKVKGD